MLNPAPIGREKTLRRAYRNPLRKIFLKSGRVTLAHSLELYKGSKNEEILYGVNICFLYIEFYLIR